jgi:hypothetical protein
MQMLRAVHNLPDMAKTKTKIKSGFVIRTQQLQQLQPLTYSSHPSYSNLTSAPEAQHAYATGNAQFIRDGNTEQIKSGFVKFGRHGPIGFYNLEQSACFNVQKSTKDYFRAMKNLSLLQ